MKRYGTLVIRIPVMIPDDTSDWVAEMIEDNYGDRAEQILNYAKSVDLGEMVLDIKNGSYKYE